MRVEARYYLASFFFHGLNLTQVFDFPICEFQPLWMAWCHAHTIFLKIYQPISSQINRKYATAQLKALFNNVFTLKKKNLSCMSLHAISIFDEV